VIAGGGRVILASHLGRPKGNRKPELSLAPVSVRLSELLDKSVIMAPDCIGADVKKLVASLADGDILLLENLRFHEEETKNDPGFAASLAELADVYANDAFGTAHRAHASTEGITRHIETCAAGFLIEKEIDYFANVLAAPQRPFIAILGGAKISGKIPVIENLIHRVDILLIGGGMAFTFFKTLGAEIGKSLLEKQQIESAGVFIERARKAGKQLLLPDDIIIADAFQNDAERKTVPWNQILPDWMGLDIGPHTIKQWQIHISKAKTIVWNGPMGAFEMSNFANGTVEIARAIASSGAISIVGGGDSVAALDVAGVRNDITHVSTGGGASLDFLAGKDLPGISALTDK
jgi:phosphoglycerate kinase